MTASGAGIPVPPDRISWRRRLARLLRPLRTIRGRLAALVTVAAVPLLLLSGTIAWQNYTLALDRSLEAAIRGREAAVARHFAAIDGAQQVLRTLSQIPEMSAADPAACQARLADLLALEPGRYANFTSYDELGKLRCSARKLPAGMTPARLEGQNQDLLKRAAASSDGFALGEVQPSLFGAGLVLRAAQAEPAGAPASMFLVVGLRLDWFAAEADRVAPGPGDLWLVDTAGRPTPIGKASTRALPGDSRLSQLLRGPAVLRCQSEGGEPFAYASALLPGGVRLVVGYPAAADVAEARAVLIRRLAELAVLLGLGLAAVGVGTHAALIQPLDGLGRAVRQWRRGGDFDPGRIVSPPREIALLARSFAAATRSLSEQGERLRQASAQQELLMKEIHHRVKNNLQIVASLLNLQASRIRLPEARAEFASARDRVRALATLHRHLYFHGDLTTISMGPFLEELTGQLLEAMGEHASGRIRLEVEASQVDLSSDQAVPLALIVTEAVSNALKYAFPGGRTGHISVRFLVDGKQARLSIADDGVGMPSGPAETETGTRDGLGIQLIRGFSKQLGATLEVSHAAGTLYQVSFPLQES